MWSLLALEKLKRTGMAQAERRQIFERWLDPDALRVWLRGLPAFEDFEAEQEALDLVGRHPDATLALAFLVDWPDLKRAGQLVRDRLDQLDGRAYTVLRPAAETLTVDHPAAATLCIGGWSVACSTVQTPNTTPLPHAISFPRRRWRAR